MRFIACVTTVVLGALALASAGCGMNPDCVCEGDVPTGTIRLRCGESTCEGGQGYRCVGPQSVSVDPTLCSPACSPACGGRKCGDDGCGGSCGTCASSKTCAAGRCTDPNFCAVSDCLAGFSHGGCCYTQPYCVGFPGDTYVRCSSTCGDKGYRCIADSDCCSGHQCIENSCS